MGHEDGELEDHLEFLNTSLENSTSEGPGGGGQKDVIRSITATVVTKSAWPFAICPG